MDLPGLSVLIGGMWIANLSYWGFNQYIIQRALAAKSIDEAQRGVLFAAFLKLIMPLIIVVPGIAAVLIAPGLPKPDEAYPSMMRLLPTGRRIGSESDVRLMRSWMISMALVSFS